MRRRDYPPPCFWAPIVALAFTSDGEGFPGAGSIAASMPPRKGVELGRASFDRHDDPSAVLSLTDRAHRAT